MFKRLTNCSLYQQLIIPIFIVGITGVFATIYSALFLEDSVSALGEIYTDGDRNLILIESLESAVSYYRTLSLRHLASERSSIMAKISNELDSTSAKLQINLQLISGNTNEDDNNVRRLTSSLSHYHKTISKAVSFSADFEKELAFVSLTEAEEKYLPSINSSLQNLKRQEFEALSSLRKTLMSAASRNLVITIAIGIGGGGLTLLIAFIVTRRTTNRLSNLLTWSRQVSQGNLSAPLQSDSQDELGRLTSSMKNMADNIQQAHNQLALAKIKAEATAEELQIYGNAFENSGEAILIADKNNNIININSAFTNQTGFTLNDVIGKNPRIFASGKTPESTYQQLWKSLDKNSFWQGELWDRKKDNKIYPKWASISAIRDDNNAVLFYIASFTDISKRKQTEAQIEHLAHHDILTGLHNRFDLENHLEQAITNSSQEQLDLALLFIDLDRFKIINDTLGHHVGDKLLVEVANSLKTCVRSSDIVARIGGDEFIIVLTNLHDQSQIALIADKIIETISSPYQVDGHELNTSPSIGISVYPKDGDTVDELMRTADVAMYHAKDHGRNSYQFFHDSMLVVANERVRIERELRNALDNDELLLYYQPQIRASDLKIISMEALIRWQHPAQGIITPDNFIPIAEDTGMIHQIGKWVIEESCRQLVKWKASGFTDYLIAINLSARQLQSETLSEDIKSILDLYSLQGNDIELEITETAAMNDPEKAVLQLESLRNLGVQLAIDDFGTGYSSLAYLKRLPIQTLKLDKSFVRDIETDPNDAAICTATVALAHNLGLVVVAEGVENIKQRDFLVENNCDYLQGYLFSKPLPADDITELLLQDKQYEK